MSEYEFTLRFRLPPGETDSDALVDRLYEAGCDDALIGIGRPGRIAVDFIRDAGSALDAISSAISEVMRAVPGATLVEVTPDLVGVTDAAEMVGCSRQNMQKLLALGGSKVPAPLHEGAWAIWHLSQLLQWLVAEKRYHVSSDLLELSDAAMRVNVAVDSLQIDAECQEKIRALLAR